MQSDTLKAVKSYIYSKYTTGALLLTGEWGSGKTWFINHDLKELLAPKESDISNDSSSNSDSSSNNDSSSNSKPLKAWFINRDQKKLLAAKESDTSSDSSSNTKPLIVVSLFGKETPDEVMKAIKTEALSDKSKKALAVAGQSKGIAKSILSEIPFFGDYIGDNLDRINIDVLIDRFAKISRDAILVFDDFERCTIDIEVLMGVINHYAEVNENKIIIVANENMIPNSANRKHKYNEFKEKLISKTVKYIPDSGHIITSIINKYDNNQKYHSFLLKQKGILGKWLGRCMCNIRLLERALQDYEELWKSINSEITSVEYEYKDLDLFYDDYFAHYLSIYPIPKLKDSKGESQNSALDDYNKSEGFEEDEKTAIIEWIVSNEWNDAVISKSIIRKADQYKTSDPEAKLLRAESFLMLDDEILNNGWNILINKVEDDTIKSDELEKMIVIQEICRKLEINLPRIIDDELILRYVSRNCDWDKTFIAGLWIKGNLFGFDDDTKVEKKRENGAVEEIKKIIDAYFASIPKHYARNIYVDEFVASLKDSKNKDIYASIRKLAEYFDAECGQQLAEIFMTSLTNNEMNVFMNDFTWFIEETYINNRDAYYHNEIINKPEELEECKEMLIGMKEALQPMNNNLQIHDCLIRLQKKRIDILLNKLKDKSLHNDMQGAPTNTQ